MSKMTTNEWRAVTSLSSIMSLRMVGLFMVLPIFSLYATQLKGATPTLIGISIGIYGLCQALFQLPFGALSDRLGRKPIILIGLLLFIAGSFIAGSTNQIYVMIIGRALQGTGAIGSTLLAMMADLTREEQRTKSMAIAGISIGFSFSFAMILGPLLMKWMSMSDLFFLAVFFGLIAILFLCTWVPNPPTLRWHRDTEAEFSAFFKLMRDTELLRLNLGIFILHAIFTASFVVIPISIYHSLGFETHNQWLLYLPTLLIAFLVSLLCISLAERKFQLKIYFLGSIFVLTLSEFILWLTPHNVIGTSLGLGLFFTSFSLLEAFLPSLISRMAPATRKGTALGIYSCAQFLGIFVGGMLGGWLYGQFNFTGVYLFSISLAFLWLIIAFLMQTPRYFVTQTMRLVSTNQPHWESIVSKLRLIPGIVEVSLIPEENKIYLKMECSTVEHPDFIRLKEQLQLNSL